MTDKHNLSFDELITSLNEAVNHPMATAWDIYYFINNNLGSSSSVELRTVLSAYFKIEVARPSKVHSAMLSVALKMSEHIPDFRLPSFLKMWRYPQFLLEEDKRDVVDEKNHRTYLSLEKKVNRKLLSYFLHHQEDRSLMLEFFNNVDVAIKCMVATKVFETNKNGRRIFSVKLVSAEGDELLVDSHVFPCRFYEIQNRMFDVSVLASKTGNARAMEVVQSRQRIEDVFPVCIGYVDRIDEAHNHQHVYDSLSRHFVADSSQVRAVKGSFVLFSPVVPKVDKFKTAYIHRVINTTEALQNFCVVDISIVRMSSEYKSFAYTIDSPLPETPEGIYSSQGFVNFDTPLLHLDSEMTELSVVKTEVVTESNVKVGDKLQAVILLKRGRDGMKHNSVLLVIRK